MDLSVIAQALGMFAVTNVDDIVVLALFFSQDSSRRGALRVVIGQYLGFAAILVVAVAGALGAGLLPEAVLSYLGLLPLVLGLRAGWQVWAERGSDPTEDEAGSSAAGVFAVALVTFANGGDNIGVYVPVFATSETGGLVTYCVVFLAMVGVWCGLGRFCATRPIFAKAVARYGHVVLPVVLIGIGLLILVEGGAFGL